MNRVYRHAASEGLITAEEHRVLSGRSARTKCTHCLVCHRTGCGRPRFTSMPSWLTKALGR